MGRKPVWSSKSISAGQTNERVASKGYPSAGLTLTIALWLLLRRDTGNVAFAYLNADQLAKDDPDLTRPGDIFAAASEEQAIADLLSSW